APALRGVISPPPPPEQRPGGSHGAHPRVEHVSRHVLSRARRAPFAARVTLASGYCRRACACAASCRDRPAHAACLQGRAQIPARVCHGGRHGGGGVGYPPLPPPPANRLPAPHPPAPSRFPPP